MKIDTHTPVNKTAALVTSKAPSNSSFDALADCKNRGQFGFWKNPKPHVIPSNSSRNIFNGVRLLRAVVTGYIGNKKWQLKCCCGNYYQKTAKAIRTNRPVHGVCPECYRRYDMLRHNDYLKNPKPDQKDIDWYILNR